MKTLNMKILEKLFQGLEVLSKLCSCMGSKRWEIVFVIASYYLLLLPG